MDINENRLEAQDLNQQGAVLLKAGQLELAKKKFDRAIEIDPMLMDSYKNYGDLYMAMEKYQEAKNLYKKAILIEKNGLLYFLYGNACFMNDELHEGLENYNIAINEGYDSDEMMFFMGMAYEHMNDDNMAYRYFKKACVKNPSRADYIVKKITVMIRLNMIAKAKETTEELLKIAPEMFDGYHIKTQLLLYEEKYEEAIKFSEAASERFPEDTELFFDYTKSLTLSNQLEKALSEIQIAKSMKYFEDEKRDFLNLEAQILAEQNKTEEAILCCNECKKLENGEYFDGEVRFMLMNLYLSSLDYENTYKEATDIVNNDAEDLFYYAALYYKPFCKKKMGDEKEATELYKEANSIYRLATLKNPEAVDIYLYRAMCLKDIEQYEKSLELLDFILGLTNKVAEVYTIKADIYQIQGRADLVKENMNKAYELKPELRQNENNEEGE